MSDAPNTTNHADEGQHAENGGANNRTDVHFIGTDKPLMVAVAIAMAGIAIWIAYSNHESDQQSIREFSEWSAKTYNREVAIDADLNILGINSKARYGAIPLPPSVTSKKDK